VSKQTKQQPNPTEDDTTVTITIMIVGGIVFAVAITALFLLTGAAGFLG
jgi:hypothetical protein